MATKQSDPSAINTSSVLDALNRDDYKKSSETESEDDNGSKATILQFNYGIIITMRSIKRIIMSIMRDFWDSIMSKI